MHVNRARVEENSPVDRGTSTHAQSLTLIPSRIRRDVIPSSSLVGQSNWRRPRVNATGDCDWFRAESTNSFLFSLEYDELTTC